MKVIKENKKLKKEKKQNVHLCCCCSCFRFLLFTFYSWFPFPSRSDDTHSNARGVFYLKNPIFRKLFRLCFKMLGSWDCFNHFKCLCFLAFDKKRKKQIHAQLSIQKKNQSWIPLSMDRKSKEHIENGKKREMSRKCNGRQTKNQMWRIAKFHSKKKNAFQNCQWSRSCLIFL